MLSLPILFAIPKGLYPLLTEACSAIQQTYSVELPFGNKTHEVNQNQIIFGNTFGKAEGLAIKQNKKLIISFPGTRDLEDWKTNLQCQTRPYGFGTSAIHAGYFRKAEQIQKALCEVIFQLAEKDTEIHLCGFSAGCGVSIAMAPIISKNFENSIRLTMFGGPKVLDEDGNKALIAKIGAQNFVRVFVRNELLIPDPVTILPYGLSFIHPEQGAFPIPTFGHSGVHSWTFYRTIIQSLRFKLYMENLERERT